MAAILVACGGLALVGGLGLLQQPAGSAEPPVSRDSLISPASMSFAPPPLPIVSDLSRRKLEYYRDELVSTPPEALSGQDHANHAPIASSRPATLEPQAPPTSASPDLPYANVIPGPGGHRPVRPMMSAASPRPAPEQRITILPPPIERPSTVEPAPVMVDSPARPWQPPASSPPSPSVPAPGFTTPNRTMQSIAVRADQCNRRGFELASKGALYSARAEFIKALRLLAGALDAEAGASRHGDALADGLLALDESDDFLDRGLAVDRRIDVPAVIAAHRTVVLKEASGNELTALIALTRYYSYAQEQLAAAIGHEPTGSVALYGLGKVYSTLVAADPDTTVAGGPKAIALHQAALAVDSRNALAAHELGVLLARCGQFEGARAALAHSASQASRPETWRSLALVLEQIGDHTAAAQARHQAAMTASQNRAVGGTGSPQQPLIWLEPGQFATTSVPQAEASPGTRPAATGGTPNVAPGRGNPPTSGPKNSFPWPIRMGTNTK